MLGAITALLMFAPELAARLHQGSGFYWGSLLGITLGIGRALFSKSGLNDLNQDFLAFMMPYLTVRGLVAATHTAVGQYEMLRISMDYDLRSALGCAAVQWEDLNACPQLSRDLTRIALVVGLYARTLVIHSETREELFRRIGEVAQQLAAGHEEFEIGEWLIRAGGKSFQIWPWILMDVEQLAKPKMYQVTLIATEPGKVGLDLKMALGLEQVLTPSAPLIALSALCQQLSLTDRKRLGEALLAVNKYYGHAEAASRLKSDYDALNVANLLLTAQATNETGSITPPEADVECS